jgi:hypothetical protein
VTAQSSRMIVVDQLPDFRPFIGGVDPPVVMERVEPVSAPDVDCLAVVFGFRGMVDIRCCSFRASPRAAGRR